MNHRVITPDGGKKKQAARLIPLLARDRAAAGKNHIEKLISAPEKSGAAAIFLPSRRRGLC
ncbi:MAG: hypothetical protein ACFNT5_07990, partial [Cardiobacterium hominis]